MRENRTCGSEGGEAQSLPYPYPLPPRLNIVVTLLYTYLHPPLNLPAG